MRVSVVVPVFNRPGPVVRAVESALAQDVHGMEVVVVDDGSRPPLRLPEPIAALPHVRVVRHEKNVGASSARNTGVGAARGEWIAFLDSDDYWLSGTLGPRLEVAERNFAADRDALVLYAAGFVIDNKRTQRRDARIPRASADPAHFAGGCWFSPGSTILFRKETYVRIGPSDPSLPRLEDLDWFLRLALAGGRLEVWPHLAAVVETGSKPTLATIEETARLLRAKYARGQNGLAPALVRRMDAFLDVERASIFAAQRSWARMAYHLARSLWRVPRLTLQLEAFWRHVAVPQRLEPAVPASSAWAPRETQTG